MIVLDNVSEIRRQLGVIAELGSCSALSPESLEARVRVCLGRLDLIELELDQHRREQRAGAPRLFVVPATEDAS